MLLATWEVFPKQKLWSFSVRAWVSTWSISQMSQTWQNVTPKCQKRDQTKYCIKRNPDERISYEIHGIYMLSIICVLLNKRFHNTEISYFEVIIIIIIFFFFFFFFFFFCFFFFFFFFFFFLCLAKTKYLNNNSNSNS